MQARTFAANVTGAQASKSGEAGVAASVAERPGTGPGATPAAAGASARAAGTVGHAGGGNAAELRLGGDDAPVVCGVKPGFRLRHHLIKLSFVAAVLMPAVVSALYLFLLANDQFHSDVAFSVRSEDQTGINPGLLGAITQMSTGTATDADILYEFIASQRMVEAIDARADLRRLYRKASGDPVFRLGDAASTEDLIDYWNRMVDITFEQHAGIIRVRAKAFAAEDARQIAQAILDESSALVNRLSEQARQDAIRFAAVDVEEAEGNLRQQRKKLAEFRSQYRVMNPEADVAGQMGLLSALQSELAQALVERDTLLSYADQDDQRVMQANRRIDAITARISAERTSLGIGGIDVAITDVIGRYEELRTDLEFASEAYTQALANLTLARAEARRQARYLAVHIEPTLAEEPLYPRRGLLSLLVAGFLFLGWSIAIIFYYNVRDSR